MSKELTGIVVSALLAIGCFSAVGFLLPLAFPSAPHAPPKAPHDFFTYGQRVFVPHGFYILCFGVTVGYQDDKYLVDLQCKGQPAGQAWIEIENLMRD